MPSLTEIITNQALEIITRTSPFGNIPLVSTAIKEIAAKSINIALHNTILSGYIKEMEEQLDKNADKVKDARNLLNNSQLTAEERAKYEDQIKDNLRNILSFKP